MAAIYWGIKMTCETCIFKSEVRQGHEIAKQTVCRRYPPTVYPIPQQGGIGIITLNPVVQPDSICGEYICQDIPVDKLNLVN
jgi:hypothetical protein